MNHFFFKNLINFFDEKSLIYYQMENCCHYIRFSYKRKFVMIEIDDQGPRRLRALFFDGLKNQGRSA